MSLPLVACVGRHSGTTKRLGLGQPLWHLPAEVSHLRSWMPWLCGTDRAQGEPDTRFAKCVDQLMSNGRVTWQCAVPGRALRYIRCAIKGSGGVAGWHWRFAAIDAGRQFSLPNRWPSSNSPQVLQDHPVIGRAMHTAADRPERNARQLRGRRPAQHPERSNAIPPGFLGSAQDRPELSTLKPCASNKGFAFADLM